MHSNRHLRWLCQVHFILDRGGHNLALWSLQLLIRAVVRPKQFSFKARYFGPIFSGLGFPDQLVQKAFLLGGKSCEPWH